MKYLDGHTSDIEALVRSGGNPDLLLAQQAGTFDTSRAAQLGAQVIKPELGSLPEVPETPYNQDDEAVIIEFPKMGDSIEAKPTIDPRHPSAVAQNITEDRLS